MGYYEEARTAALLDLKDWLLDTIDKAKEEAELLVLWEGARRLDPVEGYEKVLKHIDEILDADNSCKTNWHRKERAVRRLIFGKYKPEELSCYRAMGDGLMDYPTKEFFDDFFPCLLWRSDVIVEKGKPVTPENNLLRRYFEELDKED